MLSEWTGGHTRGLAALGSALPGQISTEAAWSGGQAALRLLLGDVPLPQPGWRKPPGMPLLWMRATSGWDDIYAPMGGAFLAWASVCRICTAGVMGGFFWEFFFFFSGFFFFFFFFGGGGGGGARFRWPWTGELPRDAGGLTAEGHG